MAHAGTYILIAIATWAASLIWRAASLQVRASRAARTHGCKPPPAYTNLEPFLGLDALVNEFRAGQEGRLSAYYEKLHKTYGKTFTMKTSTFMPSIYTVHPENLKAVCATQFDDFGVEPRRGDLGTPFFEHGVMTDDGPRWKHARALIRPTFSRAEIANLPTFEKHVARFLRLLPRDGRTVDLQPMLKRLFLDSSTEFLFGESLESQLPEAAAATAEFMDAFDASLLGMGLRLMAGPLKPLFVLDPTWKKHYTKVHAYVDRHVAAALARPDTPRAADSKEPHVLLHDMVQATRDPYELRHQILNVFFPARDTSAMNFTNLMFLLARSPEWWARVRAEVLALGDAGRPSALTFEALKALRVCRAVISEALRLHLPALFTSRVALRDTTLPVGGGREGARPVFVAKGQEVLMGQSTVQRDAGVWGADAHAFRPERWLDEGRPFWEARWQYLPFLGGMRMCPAQQQVLTQTTYLLVRLAQAFAAVENRDACAEYRELRRMTVESRNGALVALTPAVSSFT